MMFGRLLALVGIVMIGFGIFGIVRSMQSFPALGPVMELGTDAKAREAQLCKPGETIEEDKGASTYDTSQGHYSSSVTIYCVNGDHQKRDVTQEFANTMVSQIGGTFSNVFSGIFSSVIYFVLIGFGLVLAIIGLILGRRRSGFVSFGVPVANATGFSTTYTTQNPGGVIDLNQIIQQARDVKSAAGVDLSTRLKQLEDARNAGLISQTEYDRTRQQILDTLK